MRRLSHQQKEILKEIAMVGGLIALAVVAPNAIQLFKPSTHSKRSKRNQIDSFKRSIISLETRGLIRHKNDEVTLTQEGTRIIRATVAYDSLIKNKRSWDKKWRLIMFDIPEDRKLDRANFRLALKEYGFVQIQKSVYVSPYDCLDDIRSIAREAGLVRYISLIEANVVELNRNLISLFNLNS